MGARQASRRRVLLAVCFYDHELFRGVASYAHEAAWIVNDHMARDLWGGHSMAMKWDGIITILPPQGAPSGGASGYACRAQR